MINRHHYVARYPLGDWNTKQNEYLFHEWQLLVYEEPVLSEGKVSQDVRNLIQRFPFTSEISVIAPNADEKLVLLLLAEGTASIRTKNQNGHQSIKFSVICFDAELRTLYCQTVSQKDEEAIISDLPNEVQNAWLFDLFHRHHCLVPAPEGVHFGKTSGKHSDKFLRAANVLIGSLESSLLAFFLLPFASKLKPEKIHVDTGPLVSVAMALTQQLNRREIWTTKYTPTIESFSSYDGIDCLSAAHKDNLFLISASTSGGLKNRIVERLGTSVCIATIFYLQANNQPECNSHILCDLNEKENSYYGYPKVDTYNNSENCKWCKEGIPFAEFEGDQFLLQKRKTQYINIIYHPSEITKCSLQVDAKNFFKLAKSCNIFSVRLTSGDSDGYRDVRIDESKFHQRLFEKNNHYKSQISNLNIISPLNYIVSESFDAESLEKLWAFDESTAPIFETFCSTKSMQTLSIVDGGSVLVTFDALISMHEPRKTSEILRSIVPNGTISYFAAASIVDSSEQFFQLSAALRTGAKGPRTFSFEPGYVVFLRKRYEPRTSWEKEKEFLETLVAFDESCDSPVPNEILQRLSFLRDTGECSSKLFWMSQNGEQLSLQRDFVFLPVDNNESQADVYAIVSNLLSTAVQNNQNPQIKPDIDIIRKVLRDSIYSEALIEPNNFLKFNDAILRACILRAATSFELNYSRDLYLSSILTSLIVHEISEWRFSRGQCLMEFLIALATKHLRLCTQHINEIIYHIDTSDTLPAYVKRVASAINERVATSPTPSPA